MARTVSVKNLEQSGQQFSAEVTVIDDILNLHYTVDVETNRQGNGLWIDGKQIAGTCQFSASSKQNFRDQMYRWFR